MLRRAFLLVPLLAAVAHADAKAAWWLGDVVAKPGPGTVTAKRFGGADAPVKLASKITPTETALIAQNNANTEFTLWVVFPRPKVEKEVLLQVDGTWFRSGGFGHDDTGAQASIQLDRASALRVAKALGRPLHERTELGAGLEATWTFPPVVSLNARGPITVRLRVKNAGAKTVGFAIGGRQRGARDNRFEIKVTRNGKPVAIKDAPDFGGLMQYKPLKTGETADLSIDLRSWADLDAPGQYQIEAVYQGELAKDGVMPTTAADRKNLWDVSLAGQGSILVQ